MPNILVYLFVSIFATTFKVVSSGDTSTAHTLLTSTITRIKLLEICRSQQALHLLRCLNNSLSPLITNVVRCLKIRGQKRLGGHILLICHFSHRDTDWCRLFLILFWSQTNTSFGLLLFILFRHFHKKLVQILYSSFFIFRRYNRTLLKCRF